MSPYICILFTLTDGKCLYRFAVKADSNKLQFDVLRYWSEPEELEALRKLLPLHVSNIGNIVAVEEIFELSDMTI